MNRIGSERGTRRCTEGDLNIAHQSLPFRPTDRALVKLEPEFLLGHSAPFLKPGRNHRLTRFKSLLSGCPGKFQVPWTNILTYITAKYPTLKLIAERFVHRTTMLDCEVRYTPPCINNIRIHDGFCRTCLNAQCAGPTMVHGRGIRRQIERCDDLAEEHP